MELLRVIRVWQVVEAWLGMRMEDGVAGFSRHIGVTTSFEAEL